MTDRPIIFSAPMVQALLAGHKTQTRRVLKPQRGLTLGDVIREGLHIEGGRQCARHQVQEPAYAPGDRLWVREAHTFTQHGKAVYRADGRDQTGAQWHIEPGDPEGRIRWRPSIHMPRWASRLTLHVTEVRVQRLQEISDHDAWEEGIRSCAISATCDGPDCERDPARICGHGRCDAPIRTFSVLWESLHGEGSWDANPWCVAISFQVERANIDQARAA